MGDLEYTSENWEQICNRLGVDHQDSNTWEAPAKQYVVDYLKIVIKHLESGGCPYVMNVEIPTKHDFKTVFTSFMISFSHPWGG